jgi:hypothetical protein
MQFVDMRSNRCASLRLIFSFVFSIGKVLNGGLAAY